MTRYGNRRRCNWRWRSCGLWDSQGARSGGRSRDGDGRTAAYVGREGGHHSTRRPALALAPPHAPLIISVVLPQSRHGQSGGKPSHIDAVELRRAQPRLTTTSHKRIVGAHALAQYALVEIPQCAALDGRTIRGDQTDGGDLGDGEGADELEGGEEGSVGRMSGRGATKVGADASRDVGEGGRSAERELRESVNLRIAASSQAKLTRCAANCAGT